MGREWARRGLADLLGGASVVGHSERQLLERFATGRDESAFAAIVARHGPMVVRVCRSILTNPADVDDAFQATFLVLVRKAASLRDGDQLSPWLHGVARRVALHARSKAAQRTRRESPGVPAEPTAVDRSLQTAETRELAALIHTEIDRLTLAERSAILLCDLEGLSHQEAADQLGWPLGTVKSRVLRGRDRLRVRLLRRGVSLPAGILAAGWLTQSTASAFVSPGLAVTTIRVAVACLAGRALSTSLISVSVLSLTQGVSRTMIFTKLKAGAIALAVASSVVAVPSLVAYQNPDQSRNDRPGVKSNSVEVRKATQPETDTAATPTDLNALRLKLARTAVDSMELANPQGSEPVGSAFFFWLQQLTEAELSQATTNEQRVEVMTSLVARLEKMGDEQAKAVAARLGPLIASESGLEAHGTVWSQAWEGLKPLADHIADAKRQLASLKKEANSSSSPPPQRTEIRNGGGGMGMGGGMGAMGMGGGMGAMGMGMGGGMGGGGSVDRPARSTVPETQQALSQRLALRNEKLRQHLKSTPTDDEANKAILQKLEEHVSMNFPTETPLADLVKYIREATKDKTRFPIGLPIYIDPQELENVEKTDQSTIAISLDGLPLRTTFTLALKQLGLTYIVENGLVIVVSLTSQDYPVTPSSFQGPNASTSGVGPGGFQ